MSPFLELGFKYMKSLYGILTIILNCCNISCSAIQKDCLLAPPFPDYTSIFLFFSDCRIA